MSQLIINRKKQVVGCAANYSVIIDGVICGSIKNGGSFSCDLSIGDHMIVFKFLGKIYNKICFSVFPNTNIITIDVKLNKITGELDAVSNDAVLKNNMDELKGVTLLPDTMSPEEKLRKQIIGCPNIALQPNEICYYSKIASSVYQKNVVVGKVNKGGGMSVRVAKGVSVRSGSSASQVVRGNVEEKFDGTLYITNLRIILLTLKHGFDIPFSKITQILFYDDGFQVYSKSKCYSVSTKDVSNIAALLDLINQLEKVGNKEADPKNNVVIEEDISKQLRMLKELCDDGIITEDEFSEKKRKILNI